MILKLVRLIHVSDIVSHTPWARGKGRALTLNCVRLSLMR